MKFHLKFYKVDGDKRELVAEGTWESNGAEGETADEIAEQAGSIIEEAVICNTP